jgi:hypothetical protein
MLSAEGMTDEEVEKNIIQHWHNWNKPKTQLEETKREKHFETRKAKKEAKKLEKNQEKKLLQENKTVFPMGFWKEPTALIPKDKSEFPDFPNIDGLPKEEADNSIIEFWKNLKEEKGFSIENARGGNSVVFRKIKTVFPKGFWKEPTALIPNDKSEFPDFPNIDGLPKEEADSSIIEFWKKLAEKRESKTFFPKGFWKEPTALIPKDKSEFPDFPNIDGLPKEEADNSMYELITYFHEFCINESTKQQSRNLILPRGRFFLI